MPEMAVGYGILVKTLYKYEEQLNLKLLISIETRSYSSLTRIPIGASLDTDRILSCFSSLHSMKFRPRCKRGVGIGRIRWSR